MKTKKKELIEIDCKLIQELRDRGLAYKATQILNSYYKEKKGMRKQGYADIMKRERLIKKHYKICTVSSCKSPAFKKCTMCKFHTVRHRKSKIKYNKKELR